MTKTKSKKTLGLAAKVFIGFAAGIILGLIFGKKVLVLSPLGDIFLNMIKMIVVPMVFFSITAGIASMGDIKKLRNIGVKVVGMYVVTSAISVLIGYFIATLIDPGKGFDMSTLSGAAAYEAQEMPSIVDTIIDMFPSNVVSSMVSGNMLQIIVFATFLGIALILMGDATAGIVKGIDTMANVMYKITGIVMEFSPIGVAALMAKSVGEYGLSIFGPLGKLILTVYVSDIALVFLLYVPIIVLIAKIPLRHFFKNIWKVWIVTASTTSSSGSLPVTTSVVNDDFGVSPEISAFSLPLGATINMNGGCIYYAAAIVLTAQVYGVTLTPSSLFVLILSTVMVSMGCPGVPGGAIIMTTILLTNMGLPLEIVGMIAGIFRLIDMANTTFNVTGDVVTTLAVARNENLYIKEPQTAR